MPRIYLSNEPADVSGYLIAYVGMRSPVTTALVTSVTNTTSSGDNIQATATAAGTALKWITKPFQAAATLATKVQANIWALESAAAANAGLGVNLYPYASASEGSVFLDHNDTVELGTTAALMRFTTAAATSQAFAAGDRLVIKLFAIAVGTMGASQTVTIDYSGPTRAADGDTFIDIAEDFRVNETQQGAGTNPLITSNAGQLIEFLDTSRAMMANGLFTGSAIMRVAIDQAQFELNLLHPRSAVAIPV